MQYDWCPYKKGGLGQRDTDIGRTPCEDEDRVGVLLLQVKEHQRLPESTKNQRRGMQQIPPHSLRRNQSTDTLILDL